MTVSGYVGWEEVYVCREKGKREIHYIMKRRDGGKDLAVIAKEKSLRHITYRFLLDFNLTDTTSSFRGVSVDGGGVGGVSVGCGGLKPRSKRELVDWLNSFLPDSPCPAPTAGGSPDVNETNDLDVGAVKGTQPQKVGSMTKEFLWVGSSWTCKKQRKHYQAFCRNGIKISVNEFVHVLAEENNRLVAYIDDMYEDTKGNKMVMVRWFHKIDEVGLDLPHDFNDREVFFSLCLQDLSIECIDGLTMVLSPEHYEKFLREAKHTKLEPYVCNRQFDNDELEPFDIMQVKGYMKQDILKYMFAPSTSKLLGKTCPEDSKKRELNSDASGSKPRKRLRLSRDWKMNIPCSIVNDEVAVIGRSNLGLKKGPLVTVSRTGVNTEAPHKAFAIGSVVEVLSQDSGMRGCWFRATIIKKHKNKVKLSYHDIKDAENEANCLQEWVLATRIAVRDEMGLRLHGRTTIRPSFPSHRGKISWAFNVGAVIDAWQHNGWWEGIIIQKQADDIFRVYFTGEKREAILGRTDLRHSQEWMENTWRELNERPDVAESILSGVVQGETAGQSGDMRKKDSSSNLLESNKKLVRDLLKDDYLSQLKWKTVGKRNRGSVEKRKRFSVETLHPRSTRVHCERTVSHLTKHKLLVTSTMNAGKESRETSKVDRGKFKYNSDSLFSPSVAPPPLTSLVMSR